MDPDPDPTSSHHAFESCDPSTQDSAYPPHLGLHHHRHVQHQLMVGSGPLQWHET
jgi:hypothetical protein